MKRLHHIDALRGLAALAVAWFHFTKGGPTDFAGAGSVADFITASGAKGWLGVEVFFVISGFILPYTMWKAGYQPRNFATFLKKRIVRLDPPYFVALALTLVLWWGGTTVPGFEGDPFALEPKRLLLHLGYLNAFFDYPWYNPVFWTLAIEFQFYLLLAALFPALLHRLPVVRALTVAAMCASAFLIPHGAFVFHYLALFALGVVTAHYLLGLISLVAYIPILAAVAGITVLATDPLVAGVGVCAALVIAFARIPKFSALAWLGAVSYSLYLVHIPVGGRVVNIGERFADTLPMQIGALLAAVSASLIAAHLLYRLVELPSQRWSSSIKYDRNQAQASTKNEVVEGIEMSAP